MKELEKITPVEINVKKEQQIEYQFDGEIKPHKGHTLWEICEEDLSVEKAKFMNNTYVFGEEIKREVLKKSGCVYISALNKKSALKKYHKGLNGSKRVNNNPLSL